ncbi:hypothetical protein QTP70_008341 [Hemibagrus guttatus]|uniref:SLIT-ROBO Rho GTPase-activating protein 3 n=1 Tax=Hemibagrus guttatus TaxID=175788 RepID=A0AAE0RKP7_9TELE|nr:hypothetical protein QTP70_008341 [Hemibagrus guttatus]
MPHRLKSKIYRTVVRPVALYRLECWPAAAEHEQALHVMEMRILRWSVSLTRWDHVMNTDVRKIMGIVPVTDKMQEARLRWYGHVIRSADDSVAKTAMPVLKESGHVGDQRNAGWIKSQDMKRATTALEDALDCSNVNMVQSGTYQNDDINPFYQYTVVPFCCLNGNRLISISISINKYIQITPTSHNIMSTERKDQHLLSSVNCWYLVLNQTRRESRDYATLNDIYINNVIVRLAQISEDVIRLFKKIPQHTFRDLVESMPQQSKEIGIQMHEELVKVTNELYTVMKTYHMYHTESISAESKLKDAEKQEEKQYSKSGDLNVNLLRHEERAQRRSSVRKIEKMKEKRQAKYSENKLKCTKARNDYLLNLAATNAVVAKYYIHDVSDMIDCCDLGYHASLARMFRTYLSAEYNLETSRHEGLDLIESAVDNLDSRSDKHKIMDMYNQVFCPPMRFEYLPHMGDEVCQVSAQQPVQTELLMRYHQLQSRLATLKIENEEVRKTLDATMQTLQDMLTVEDFDVSDAFQHSRSTESIKSVASEGYMSKLNIAKRRSNQQETELFYFTKFKEYLNGSNLIIKLQSKHDLLKQTLGEGERAECGTTRPPTLPPKPQKLRKPRPRSVYNHKLFNGNMETFIKDSGQPIPLVVESCIRYINLYGLQQQGIFRVPGSQVEVNDIKNSFERGEDPLIDDQSDHDINSVAGVLKLYFRGLENPLFPKERFLDFISTIKLESSAERVHHLQQIIVTLPRTIIIVMRYLFAFLNQTQ